MRISLPGAETKNKRVRKRTRGYILMDMLLAILLLSLGFLVLFRSITSTGAAVIRQEERVLNYIDETNMFEEQGVEGLKE